MYMKGRGGKGRSKRTDLSIRRTVRRLTNLTSMDEFHLLENCRLARFSCSEKQHLSERKKESVGMSPHRAARHQRRERGSTAHFDI